MHFCVGSYVRIMTSCAIPAERRFDPFCEKIMLSLCPDGAAQFSYTSADGNDVIYTYTNFNKIHSSRQNLPAEVMKMALTKDAHDIERYFISMIIPAMNEARKKNAVLALKDVILKDPAIADTAQLGSLSHLTKNELKLKNEFVLSEFLADTFIYAATQTDNMVEADFTRSIKKSFCANYDQATDTIKLYDITKQVGINIPLEKKTEENLGLLHLSENDKKLLKMFHADFDDIIRKSIESDLSDVWLMCRSSEKIDNLSNKWKGCIMDFEDISLQADVLHTIATFRKFCDALTPDGERVPGTSVRKLRIELRNCYVKIHPNEYADIFPYDAFIDDWNDGEDFF